MGKSRKEKGNICPIQTIGLAQGNERTESITAPYEERRKKQPDCYIQFVKLTRSIIKYYSDRLRIDHWG